MNNTISPTFPAPVVWMYRLSRTFTPKPNGMNTFCIPAVAPIRTRAFTPVSGDPVAIWDVELVDNSHVPAAAVTIENKTPVIVPDCGIWIVCDVAAVTLRTIDRLYAMT